MNKASTAKERAGREPCAPLAYSVAEAARASGLSRTTLYGLMLEGVLPHAKVGGRRLILAADLEAFLARHRVTSG